MSSCVESCERARTLGLTEDDCVHQAPRVSVIALSGVYTWIQWQAWRFWRYDQKVDLADGGCALLNVDVYTVVACWPAVDYHDSKRGD
jgi:hypothetical protein